MDPYYSTMDKMRTVKQQQVQSGYQDDSSYNPSTRNTNYIQRDQLNQNISNLLDIKQQKYKKYIDNYSDQGSEYIDDDWEELEKEETPEETTEVVKKSEMTTIFENVNVRQSFESFGGNGNIDIDAKIEKFITVDTQHQCSFERLDINPSYQQIKPVLKKFKPPTIISKVKINPLPIKPFPKSSRQDLSAEPKDPINAQDLLTINMLAYHGQTNHNQISYSESTKNLLIEQFSPRHKPPESQRMPSLQKQLIKNNNFPNELPRTLEYDPLENVIKSNLQLLKINPSGGGQQLCFTTNDSSINTAVKHNPIYYTRAISRDEVNKNFLGNISLINSLQKKKTVKRSQTVSRKKVVSALGTTQMALNKGHNREVSSRLDRLYMNKSSNLQQQKQLFKGISEVSLPEINAIDPIAKKSFHLIPLKIKGKSNKKPENKELENVLASQLNIQDKSYQRFDQNLENMQNKLQKLQENKKDHVVDVQKMKIDQYTSQNCFFVKPEVKTSNVKSSDTVTHAKKHFSSFTNTKLLKNIREIKQDKVKQTKTEEPTQVPSDAQKDDMNWLTKSDIDFFKKRGSAQTEMPGTAPPKNPKKPDQDIVQNVMNLLAKKHVARQSVSITLEEIQKKSGIEKLDGIIDEELILDTGKQETQEKPEPEQIDENQDQEPEVDRQDLGDIQQVFKHIDLRELQVRQMNARIANSYFPDKQAIKVAKFDIKTALLDGAKKQQKIRDFHEHQQAMASLPSSSQAILIANGDYDIEQTQKEMINNQSFREFFESYQKNMGNSLEQLDYIASNKRIASNNFYICSEQYLPQITDFVKHKNLYRNNNQETIEKSIKTDQFNRITDGIERSIKKVILPDELAIQVKQLRKQQRKEKMLQEAEINALKSDDIYYKSNPVLPHAKKLEFELGQMNKIRQKNYGKWYLNPNHFNKKIEHVKTKVQYSKDINM